MSVICSSTKNADNANRDRMVERTGRFQVPYLVDNNTGIEMFEGPEIVQYLEAVYTVKEE
jgi:glutaredoxin